MGTYVIIYNSMENMDSCITCRMYSVLYKVLLFFYFNKITPIMHCFSRFIENVTVFFFFFITNVDTYYIMVKCLILYYIIVMFITHCRFI